MTAPSISVSGAPPIPGLTFRSATPADWDAVARVLNLARVADRVDEVRSGEDLAAEYASLDMFQPARDLLLAEIGGEVVAFGFGYRVERDGVLVGEMWGGVRPDLRRRGLGSAIWRANRDRLAAEMASDPRSGERELRSYADDMERADIALLLAHGFVPIRFGFEMRRFLTGSLPEIALPAGIEMRPVHEDQHRAIFEADDEAFRDHWGHRPAGEGDFVARFQASTVDTGLWCVAWDGDQVAGVVMNAIYRDENEQLDVRRGWLDRVSVRRPWRGRGVARALCAASLRVLRDNGMDEAWLGVDGSNPTGALRLYERLGFKVARRWRAYGRPLDGPASPGWRTAGDRTG